MRRTRPDLRSELEALIDERATRVPEWCSFYEMLREAARALEGDRPPVLLDTRPTASRPARHPALWSAVLVVDAAELGRLVGRLSEAAGLRRSDPDSIALLNCVIAHDHERVAELAGRAGVDAAALGTVAAFAVPVLLYTAGHAVAALVPPHWPEGYCPVCGEWPLLAELRGLDRSRHLRCGRCGGDWAIAWLACPYCGENDHDRLGALVPESGRQTQRAETCATCGGYLKTVTTLRPLHLVELKLRDLETIELDVAAVEAGHTRPETAALATAMRIVEP